MMSLFNEVLIFVAAIAAGFINAIAGGGTLVTFPLLIAIGIPPVVANVTNTVARVPGTIGGMWAQRKDFHSQYQRLLKLLPVAIIGGTGGGLIILNTSEQVFRSIIPYLILVATLLLAVQVRIKNWVVLRMVNVHHEKHSPLFMLSLVLLASIYGGYFGPGLGVMLMAVLGLVTDDSLTQLNFLKQALSFAINLSAAIYFAFSGQVDWPIAFVMMVGFILGGLMGGKLATTIKPELLRWIVVASGLIAAVIFFVKD